MNATEFTASSCSKTDLVRFEVVLVLLVALLVETGTCKCLLVSVFTEFLEMTAVFESDSKDRLLDLTFP